ncbi:uncharacterized protein LOC130714344 [Lotus japonicus]|uniref:uncharacterized protein LOC130714344 n=1 Tax=Lotus japonicus TaxID=34305 RepID=UPI002589ED66|nr:uncharacterized protein LOC130714344 [Lotus japonicus]
MMREEAEKKESNLLQLTVMKGGYSDSAMVVPPSSSAEPISRKRGLQSDASIAESLHLERHRRLKMTQMFTHLQTTVPGLKPKASREVIVTKTISYIQELEKKKQRLEELKEMKKTGGFMLPCGGGSTRNCSVAVTVSSNVAFFGIQSVAQPGLVTVILKVFCKHRAEVLAANVSVNNGKLMLAITALVQIGDGNSTVEKIKREIAEFIG